MSTLLDAHLQKQLDFIIEKVSSFNLKRQYPRLHADKETKFIKATATRFLQTRKNRAEDLERQDFQAALELAQSAMLFPIYRVLCVDGRIWPSLLAGLITGGSIRIPAGNIPDFTQSESGDHLFLPDNTYFADLLTKAFAENDTIVEILDSHRGCAAAKEKAMLRAGEQIDGGLLLNVQRHMGIKAAIESWVEKYNSKHGSHKRAVVMHISSIPGSPDGGFIIGLRKEYCITVAQNNGGFTAEVLEKLFSSGEILSTNQLLTDPLVAEGLTQLATKHPLQDIDWGERYGKSAYIFWKAFTEFVSFPELLSEIRRKIVKILPYLEQDKLKLDVHAKVVLAGVLATWLKFQKNHTVHQERVCVITKHAERGPFSKSDDLDSFTIFTLDPDIHHHILLTLNLMRSIRKTISTEVYAEAKDNPLVQQQYVSAPAIFFAQEIIRDDIDWPEVQKVDWTDIANLPWFYMSSTEFLSFLKTKHISLACALAIDALRKTLVDLYNPQRVTSRLLMEGSITIFAVLADKYRKPQALIPFLLSGYKD